MPSVTVSAKAIEQAAEIGLGFGWRTPSATVERLIATFYQSYTAAELPDGWALKDDLTLGDLESYFKAYDAEGDGNAWHQRGRAIRAAFAAGWFSQSAGVTLETVSQLKPSEATQLKNAIDAFYTKQTVADPN
jgi:hypothetical protein